MDEVLGALVGLGLHAPQRSPEISSPHRRLRRGVDEEGRRARVSPGGASYDSGSRLAAEGAESSTDRERDRARAQARRRRNMRRLKIGGMDLRLILIAFGICFGVILLLYFSGYLGR